MAAAEKKNTYTAAEVAELQTTIRQQQAEIEDLKKYPFPITWQRTPSVHLLLAERTGCFVTV